MIRYVIQASLCLALMYLPCWALIRKETFFRINRIVLLSILLLSMVLPLCRITLPAEAIPATLHNMHQVNSAILDIDDDASWHWQDYALVVYLTGLVVVVAIRSRQLVALQRNIKRGCVWIDNKGNGITVYCHIDNTPSYSWLNSIVISEEDYKTHPEEVLSHEFQHVRLHHSLDNIFVMICQCVQWFNPVVYHLADALSAVHEYEVDAHLVNNGLERTSYQHLLLQRATNSPLASLSTPHSPLSYSQIPNTFDHNCLQNRVKMLNAKKSPMWHTSKITTILPLLAFALIILARPANLEEMAEDVNANVKKVIYVAKKLPVVNVNDNDDENENDNDNGIENPQPKTENPQPATYYNAEQRPVFPGGNDALRSFMSTHLARPESIEEGTRVFVNIFINADGNIDNCHVIESVSEEADHAALEMVRQMPNWIPGRIKGQPVNAHFILPVTF